VPVIAVGGSSTGTTVIAMVAGAELAVASWAVNRKLSWPLALGAGV